ncbi:hypothetical protein JAAARDRAFT_193486 [Jaapia argillacea MUCL 33604]|uniref:FZ domain-containing protein n=1 Tax=Jaapia argillacea MUCL 33604 TaxID=933084 RepID=A0A067Q5Y4_9AGAM|nr:hypothetical protein JAAARDRAFT_193486 [Jaapia argillacea MUCL 33604]
MLLPLSLLLLLEAKLLIVQAQQLSLNSLSAFTASTVPSPPSFSLPSTSDALSISVALCSQPSSQPPRFFITNNSAISDPGPDGGTDVYEIILSDGYGSWTGLMGSGGVLAVEDVGESTFEIGVATGGPLHQVLSTLPLLGDTTTNQALLFSPPFSPPQTPPPTFPNYTFPAANLTFPTQPSSTPNFTLILAPTLNDPSSTSGLTSLPQTGCALKAEGAIGSGTSTGTSSGKQIFQSMWLRDENGWRSEWLVGGLTPLTNYTAYVVQDETKVSGPIYLVTKSALFSCPLVHSLPYCPSISYAVPLPLPPPNFSAHDSRTLPDALTEPLIQYLANFTTVLGTWGCGREYYSVLKSCADCEREYRKWLCATTFPRCSEVANSTQSQAQSQGGAQQPLSALIPVPTDAPPRNPNLANFSSEYSMLLPCLETCHAVDRSCPYFLQFRCPVPRFNANVSYGVGFIDDWDGGMAGGGMTGYSQDRWGNVWCVGPGFEEGVFGV